MTPVKPVVGVLGGMGPAATADLFAKIVARTPVTEESDHLPIAIWSNPEIPDRTRALLGLGPSPVPAMADGIRRLLEIGADVVAIPCNTAHAFLGELRSATGAEFLDMIDITVQAAVDELPGIRRLGILSTAGTRHAGLYAEACRAHGLTAIELTDAQQSALVDPAIRLTKLGREPGQARRLLADATEILAADGATAVVAGCTEIPLAAGLAAEVLPIIDATDRLAAAIVDRVRIMYAGV